MAKNDTSLGLHTFQGDEANISALDFFQAVAGETDSNATITNDLIVALQSGLSTASVNITELDTRMDAAEHHAANHAVGGSDALGTDSLDMARLTGCFMVGSSTQAATPTPTAPVDIVHIALAKLYVASGKNLFCKNGVSLLPIIPTNMEVIASTAGRSIVFPCKPSTTYTISKVSSARFGIGATAAYPAVGVAVNGYTHLETATSQTVTTGANDKFLLVLLYHTTADTLTSEEILATIQIEEGDTATVYESYEGAVFDVSDIFPSSALGDGKLALCGIGESHDTWDGASGRYNKKTMQIVLDGTETWGSSMYAERGSFHLNTEAQHTAGGLCTHFPHSGIIVNPGSNTVRVSEGTTISIYPATAIGETGITNVTQFKAWLAAQYAAGTPVVIVCELAEDLTENYKLRDGDIMTSWTSCNVYADNSMEVEKTIERVSPRILREALNEGCEALSRVKALELAAAALT